MDNQQQPVRLSQRLLSYLICALIAWQPLLPALAANIVPTSKGTQLDKAANGVPVINIATPNQAGLSHNQYQNYNVGKEGLILNNATGQLTPTQLGGLIQNNPNLKAGQEAKAIINEVTGANRSQLQGYTEVAGKAANVMVANPYGITCNGCGFINTPNATLTTGKPVMDAQGNLQALTVSQGTITVEGQGLDASQSDALSLISRATEINAAIHANDLKLIAGANRVAQDGSVTPIAGSGAAPGVAVDTGALGGMYANRIHLVSSEKGVGVNLGNLNARQGDMVLDASGRLTLKNSLTSGALTAKGESIALSGDHKAGGAVTLNGVQEVAVNAGSLVSDSTISLTSNGKVALNQGKLTAGKDIQLSAAEIKTDKASTADSGNNIKLTARNGVDNAAQLTAGGTLTLSATQAKNSGALLAQQQTLHADTLDNSGAIAGQDALMITSGNLLNQGSLIAPQLTLSSPQLTNSGLIQGSKNLGLTADRLDNLSGGSIASASDLTLDLPTLNNDGLIKSDAGLLLSGDSLINSGEINAATLSASHNQLLNQQGGYLLAQGAMQLQQKQLSNEGQLAADSLVINADMLHNNGLLQGNKDLAITGSDLTNGGTLLSGGKLTLQGDSLDNQGLIQGDALSLNVNDWQNSGNALSEHDADLKTKTLHNSGKILGQHGIQLQADSSDNSGWLVAQALTLRGDLINSGLLQGNDELTLHGGTIGNQRDGQLLSGGTLELAATQLDNQGVLQADTLRVNAQSWQNSGSARASSLLDAQVNNDINNGGSLISEQALTLEGGRILNQGKLAADRLSLTSPQLTNGGLLQGNSILTLNSTQLNNQQDGELLSGGPLALTLDRLDNAGLLQVDGALDLNARQASNGGKMLADTISAQVNETLTNNGELLAQQATLDAQTLENNGALAAQTLTLTADTLHNRGALQGDSVLDITAQQLDNQASGTLLSGDSLLLHGNRFSNEGGWQGKKIEINGNTLENLGTINGIDQLTGSLRDELNNGGSLLSQGDASLTANSLTNQGKILADGLTLRGQALNNSGLWQGSSLLDAQGDSLTSAAGSRTLSGGLLALNADRLMTSGTLQGEQAQVSANNWQHQGSLLSNGGLTANVAGLLTNNGDLLSQDAAQIHAQTLTNQGDVLSAGAMTLTGGSLNNSGSVQGKTLHIAPAKVINQGSLIGLQALTLGSLPQMAGRMMLMALTTPARELINNQGGALLTQGTLTINGDNVTNNGSWQGQQILLNAQRLTNGGAIQSADVMQLILADKLDSTADSKISANGTAALQALALTNQGQWVAKNLTLNGNTLNNGGDISGVNGLTVKLNGALTQQQDKTLLTAGKLDLQAASVNNAGHIQGGELQVISGALDNRGRMQGDNNLLLTLSGRLTNAANGTLLSQKALTLKAPELFNYGLIQGGETSGINATGLANNSGKILSGGELTLNTPQLTNSGWLQATQLILNAANASNSGTLLAQQQGTLTGNGLNNQGSVQGDTLTVNYQQLTNGGTLLGNNQLNVTAAQVNQNAAGRLFSGGNLVLNSNGLDQPGQVVALGDATLKLINAFTNKGTLAAGNRLSVSSNGALENLGTMQGQALTLGAGGDLINNGQLTSGNGDSTLSGNRIAMNGSGTLQGGGNINLTSRSDIALDGFTGTLGNLTLSAPGSIVNTALLYAANNLYLYANSIKNQQGDVLAGNSLWMQRDAAGNANSEVVNTSGTIETQNGDITVKTGHLLNTRNGLETSKTTTTMPNLPANIGQERILVRLGDLSKTNGELGVFTYLETSGGGGAESAGSYYEYNYYAPTKKGGVRRYLVQQTKSEALSQGPAGRIAANRDLAVSALSLDNQASSLLAGRDINITGDILKNSSWENSVTKEYITYKVDSFNMVGIPLVNQGDGEPYNDSVTIHFNNDLNRRVPYIISGLSEYETTVDGTGLRAVIQAGSTVNLNVKTNISNTNTTSEVDGFSHTLSAPGLSALSHQYINGAQQTQSLTPVIGLAINSPQWRDQLQSALQAINGGGSLESNGGSGASLNQYDGSRKGASSLEKAAQLAAANTAGQALNHYQGNPVDTSAYPLPSGDNGYFVPSADPNSHYLITVNPKLNGLGQLDKGLYGDLYSLLGTQPETAPEQETRTQFTNEKAFLGSSYLLGRLNLHPEYDYRFLGDAAFDTRYVSNTVINQTGSRYINGIGSDLEQMRYLMDNAAAAQQSLGLQFGVSLTADQIAALDHSIIWWEAATVNGETVMVPKVYLSPKDVTVNNGSVIAGNNVKLDAGNITNSGSTLTAKADLNLDSQNSINNLNQGLINAGGDLQLSALNDINNIGSAISGKKVALESLNGSINNITQTKQIHIGGEGLFGNKVSLTETMVGDRASINAADALSLNSGKNIAVQDADIKSGGNLLMNAWGDIAVTANEINQAQSQTIRGNTKGNSSTTWQGSNISAGGQLAMHADNNLSLSASTLNAGKDAALSAGNDLNLNAATTQQNSCNGKSESHASGLDRTTITSGGDLKLAAGRDLTSQAAGLAAEGDVALQAGRDLNLQAQETRSGNSYKAGKKQEINEHVRQQGTEVASGGDTSLLAGRDLNSNATQVTAQQDIAVAAGHNVNLNTATESDYHYKEETKTKKGFLKKKTTHTIEEDSATREAGTLLSGNNVAVTAGNDLLVKGSQVVGDGSVALRAGNNVDIAAATNTDSSWRFKETKKSGLMGSGGIGFTIGSSKSVHDLREKGTTQSQSVSTVGSTGGDVAITSGGQTHIGGADLVAGKSLDINGDAVVIEPGHDKRTRDERFEQKTSGLTLALSGAVGEAINSAVATAQAAKSESDGRLAALQATKTALSGVQAVLASQQATASGDPNNGVGISVSLTTQKSKSQQHQSSDTVNGSTLNAGKDLTITANGKGDSARSGDILIGGSQMKVAGDSTLNAARDILLTGAASTQQSSGKNSSSGGGVGLSFGVGSGSAGISIFASVNGAKGKESGNGTRWSETTLDSGGNVALNSGRDATLNGAQVTGNKVTADIGRDLTISSQQDSDRYDSKQTSFGAGGSFTFGSMSGSGYISLSQDKMRSRYSSVHEQSGIFAGEGGFDITTGSHTQLNGAVIASTAEAGKNRLDTGTLGFSDIGNAADYKVSHSGISAGMSSKGSLGGQLLSNALSNTAGTLLAGLGGKGHAEGTTQSAVADGTITLRNQQQQQQNLNDLSRDTEHANGSISPIFDKEKEQKRLQMAQMAGEITGQMSNIVQTYGDIQALEKAKKDTGNQQPAGTGEKERQKWLDELRSSDAYQKEMRTWGTGSKNQMVVQSLGAIISGVAGGNAAQAAAGGLNPWVAQVIKQQTTDAEGNVNVAANAAAHAVWGAVAAQMAGGNAAAGAAGAFSGELAAHYIAEHYYHVDLSEPGSQLTEAQRQELSLMSTLAAGLAGGLAGNSTASATTGAQAGKNAVENNALSPSKNDTLNKALEDQKNGKNLLQASQAIVRLTNEDRASNTLLDKYQKGQLNDAEKQQLAGLLNQYGYELQTMYGYSEQQAAEAIQALTKGGAFVASAADAKAYNEALSYLKTYSAQSGQAALGTDALLVLPGVPGALVRGSVVAGGAHQTGTGIGQIVDGSYGDGVLNVGLGTAAIFGGLAGQGAISKPGGSIISSGDAAFWQNSTIGNSIAKSEGTLTGRVTPTDPKMTKENIRSLNRENESAQILSQSGFQVEQNPYISGNKNPDYRINGEVFDNYAPKSSNVRNIYSEVKRKVTSGQTNNVVINMSDTKASLPALQNQLSQWPIIGLEKVIVIDKSGNVIRIK
ncbi:Contact-dependent inhibition of growth factor CdiA [Pantoea alhagi]|uniref:Contact-dependent inhibition of growth factor CdiA n=1 Tax=Pantoea alhagi TaxID=1891675 RepID=A0A1W6B1J5_9GAMM|nr:hemagglutinin repeat-containing protein [Pantoea alhagi]ARJ40940.1 Contact-dependent inhibition of growth factor CdiA [Pantoea alhagi]